MLQASNVHSRHRTIEDFRQLVKERCNRPNSQYAPQRSLESSARLCTQFRMQSKNYNIDVTAIDGIRPQRYSTNCLYRPIQRVPQCSCNFVAKMQFSLNVLAVLAASASIVTATQPRRYAPQAYQPVQYGNTVPWTSSTCSAVYSTIMQTSTKPVTTVVTTTIYKPSTWTSTKPTVITSVYTTFKPATTTIVSTMTSVVVGKWIIQRHGMCISKY